MAPEVANLHLQSANGGLSLSDTCLNLHSFGHEGLGCPLKGFPVTPAKVSSSSRDDSLHESFVFQKRGV